MDKIKQKILADYKKANKAAKEKMLKKYEFSSETEFLNYLTGSGEKQTSQPVKKVRVHNIHILDASGSMTTWNKYDVSTQGILKEIETLKNDNTVDWTYGLVEFIQSNNIRTHQLLGELPKTIYFNGATGADTPLYKTVYDTINKVKLLMQPDDKVLIKVYTDGGNNTAYEYKLMCADLIKEVQSTNFTIAFAATKEDLKTIKRDIGIEDSNCLEISNDGKGFETAFIASNTATLNYAAKASRGEDVLKGFYKKSGTL